MELRDLKDHLDDRLDKIESKIEKADAKLDNHLERISKAETDISWLRGHAKLTVTLILTALSGLTLAAYQLITGKG